MYALQVYEGEYQNDRRHGYGTYRWPGGAVFTGYFRNDKKDGKGTFHSEHGETFEVSINHETTMTMPSTSPYVSFTPHFICMTVQCFMHPHRVPTDVHVCSCCLQGTYQDGVRSGEGVLTYPGCRQDVGMWCGSRLVQLKFAVHEAASPLHAGSRVLHTPDLASRGNHMPKGPLEVHHHEWSNAVVACTLTAQLYGRLINFVWLSAILALEQTASQDLILAACAGDLPHLRALTCSGVVHIDVVDRLGYSALFAAVLHSQVEVVQFLLNEGADVNRLATDTQYSPLSACCHLLYHPRVGHTKVHRPHVT